MSVARLSQTPSLAWDRRLYFYTIIVLACLGLLLAACTRPVTTEIFTTPASGTNQSASQKAPLVIIENVQVTQGEGIYITGSAALANGECIQTSLLADDAAVTWWPGDVCVQVDAGRWEMLASLGRNGAPDRLDPSVTYTLEAWWPKQKQATLAQFSLNLSSPKTP